MANSIEIMEYNSTTCSEKKVEISGSFDFSTLADISEGNTKWINIDLKGEDEDWKKVTDVFEIHPLTIEDIMNNNQRAKVEDYDEYVYIVAKMIYYRKDKLVVEQMNFILGKNYVISLGEFKGDVFDDIRRRIRNTSANHRKNGSDYLMYSFIDAIVDGYFDVIEVVSEKIDVIEDKVIERSEPECLNEIRVLSKTLINIHRYFWPLREVISWFGKESSPFIQSTTVVYIRDLYDHIIQAIETTENQRELLSGINELYLSKTSNKLNEIMKVLTIISTFFIPLTFVVGVYGMNFRHMPELEYQWGYAIVWLVMFIISILMFIFFKKKKWF